MWLADVVVADVVVADVVGSALSGYRVCVGQGVPWAGGELSMCLLHVSHMLDMYKQCVGHVLARGQLGRCGSVEA